ncbi:MAG: helix-turn-helix transcriptional regulator [Nodosilinea sp.]
MNPKCSFTADQFPGSIKGSEIKEVLLSHRSPLLSAILEGFTDGILIFNEDGDLIYNNQAGKTFIRYLNQLEETAANQAPPSLWRICGYLLEGRKLFPENPLILTQEFQAPEGDHLRVRVQYLNFPEVDHVFFLVVLEDQNRTAQSLARLEALHWSLSPQEGQVWLWRRGHRASYQEIADQLHISLNTVKSHLRSIRAKARELAPLDQGQP